MIIKKAEYSLTAVNPEQYPPQDHVEIAFAGRSNVGKSSLINAMLNRRGLARTSSEPGKTRAINFYNINDVLYFVDLPGYGYAKVSKMEKKKWGGIIERYLMGRENLADVLLLLDIRHEPTEDDKLMYRYIKNYNHSVVLVLTKCDKIPRGQYQRQVSIIKKSLGASQDDKIIIFSSLAKYGREELWSIIDTILEDNKGKPVE